MGLFVSRVKPTPTFQDGVVNTNERYSGYQEKFILPLNEKMYPLCDEGSYFTALNPTPGTGLATIAAPTTFAQTSPFILIKNQAPNNGPRIKLDYIRLVVTALGTAGTINYATHVVDAGAGYTSGGTQLTATCPNGGLNPTSNALIYAGAIVATSGTNARTVSHSMIRPVIPVNGDSYLFQFGSQVQSFVGLALDGTVVCERCIPCAPVELDPGQWYKLVYWRPSMSAAASFEVEIGWWER